MKNKYIVYTEFYNGTNPERYCYGIYDLRKADETAKLLNIETDDYHGVCKVEDAEKFAIKNMPSNT